MYIVLYLCLIFSGTLFAQDEILFGQATRAFEQSDFENALTDFKRIKDPNPTVWYNMGNAAFNLNEYAAARLYWLRAGLHGNRAVFKDSWYNLTYLDKITQYE